MARAFLKVQQIKGVIGFVKINFQYPAHKAWVH